MTNLLESLLELGADEPIRVLLARDPAGQTCLDTMSAVSRLLKKLQNMGAHEQATRLAARVAAPLDGPHVAATPLLRAPAAPTTFVSSNSGAELLQSLEEIEDIEAAVDDPETALRMMIELHRLGARGHLHTVAERAAKQAAVDAPDAAARLLRALRELKETRLVAILVDRLCAAGHFRHTLHGNQEKVFMFGREPGGDPAASWRWQDLE
ncbi:hypothetical protein ACIHFD_04695 [Nonomuraea sp. NPDC051941]|uniref:hypothetical protein n=1 Tax=Nonomuraea sp. NPDC051941 TaxID=3364373 RepID=UPI0037C518B6